MFNIGFSEMLLLFGLALIFIGPKELPELARIIGRFLNELRRNTDTLKEEFKVQGLDKSLLDIKEQVRTDINQGLDLHSGLNGPTYSDPSDKPVIADDIPDPQLSLIPEANLTETEEEKNEHGKKGTS